MSRKKYKAVNGLLVAGLMLVLVIIYTKNASAQEVITGNSGDCAGRSSACADMTVGGSDAFGLGLSSPSFGAAISQCVATEASNWIFGAYGRQKVVANYHCMGLSYLRSGMYDAGEFILCKHTELSDMPDCPAAVAQFNMAVQAMPEPEVAEEKHEELEQIHDAQLSELMALQAWATVAQMQIAELEQEPAVQTVVREVPFIDAKKRAALEELKE